MFFEGKMAGDISYAFDRDPEYFVYPVRHPNYKKPIIGTKAYIHNQIYHHGPSIDYELAKKCLAKAFALLEKNHNTIFELFYSKPKSDANMEYNVTASVYECLQCSPVEVYFPALDTFLSPYPDEENALFVSFVREEIGMIANTLPRLGALQHVVNNDYEAFLTWRDRENKNACEVLKNLVESGTAKASQCYAYAQCLNDDFQVFMVHLYASRLSGLNLDEGLFLMQFNLDKLEEEYSRFNLADQQKIFSNRPYGYGSFDLAIKDFQHRSKLKELLVRRVKDGEITTKVAEDIISSHVHHLCTGCAEFIGNIQPMCPYCGTAMNQG
jgi:hypothetical protein